MKTLLFLLVAVIVCSGCSSTNYMNYSGSGIQRGRGGAYQTLHGIELWQEGSPNRSFEVIGIITDSRPVGPWTMGPRAATVANLAKKHGGQGVIQQADVREFVGYSTTQNANWNQYQSNNGNCRNRNSYGYGYGNATANATTTPLYNAHARYLVIRYR